MPHSSQVQVQEGACEPWMVAVSKESGTRIAISAQAPYSHAAFVADPSWDVVEVVPREVAERLAEAIHGAGCALGDSSPERAEDILHAAWTEFRAEFPKAEEA